MTHQLKISVLFATILLVTMFTLCWMVGDTPGDHYINLAVFVCAWATGWALGTFIAPYDGAETALFGRLSQALGAFVSGFVLAKLNSLSKVLVDPEFILRPLPGFRVLTFFSVTIIVTIVVFIARHYATWHRKASLTLEVSGS